MGPRTALELGARRFRPRRAGDVLAARGVSFGLGVTTLPRFRRTVDRGWSARAGSECARTARPGRRRGRARARRAPPCPRTGSRGHLSSHGLPHKCCAATPLAATLGKLPRRRSNGGAPRVGALLPRPSHVALPSAGAVRAGPLREHALDLVGVEPQRRRASSCVHEAGAHELAERLDLAYGDPSSPPPCETLRKTLCEALREAFRPDLL